MDTPRIVAISGPPIERAGDRPSSAGAQALPGGFPANENVNVYQVLAVHQRCEDWNGRDLLCFLQEWAVRFAIEFELDVPELALRVDVLPRSYLGHFRPGHNGFGLRGEIALNSMYLRRLGAWEMLGVLLHELIHAWQFAHGTPSDGNHHNAEYRRKAESLGLIIGRCGITGYSAESRFKDLLHRFDIEAPAKEVLPQDRRVKGESKQKKWSCGCTNIRCAVLDLRAQCLKCGREFKKAT